MNRYKLLRYEKGLTLTDVANGSGVPARTIRALEAAPNPTPSAPTAKALAEFYRLSMAEFLGVDTDTKDAA